MPRSDSPSLPYSAALDGLRGVAIVLVLLFHGSGRLVPGGYLGVSTFFTLSGFLITSLLLLERERTGGIDLARFWTRRLRRLMPAALLGIALAAAFVALAGTPSQSTRFRWDGMAALAYGANFRAMSAGSSYWEMFSRPSPLQHYWSLSIEEQFYLLYPLLLLGVGRLATNVRRSLRIVLVLLVVASTAAMIFLSKSGASSARLYFGTDTRAGELLIGALLATFVARDGALRAWRGRGAGLVTLACGAIVIAAVAFADEDAPFLYRGGLTLYALATAGILHAAVGGGVVAALLSLRPLVLLGRISYGAYVYHWPVDLCLDGERTGLAGVPLLLLQSCVTIALASASWVLVERPIRAATGFLGRRGAVLLPTALAATVALVIATSTPREIGWNDPRKMPAVGAKAPAGPVRIVVFGDSLAFNLGAGLAAWARTSGDKAVVWNLAHYGCGLVLRPDAEERRDFESHACLNWREFWADSIARFQPDVVVIASGLVDLVPLPRGAAQKALRPGDGEFDRELLSIYRSAVDIASAGGARVVWVNTPCTGTDAEGRLRGVLAEVDQASIGYLNRTLLPALVVSRPALAVFDLFGVLCPGGRFVRSLDGMTTTRSDALHLTSDAANKVGRQIVAQAFPIVAGVDLAGLGRVDRAARDLPARAQR